MKCIDWLERRNTIYISAPKVVIRSSVNVLNRRGKKFLAKELSVVPMSRSWYHPRLIMLLSIVVTASEVSPISYVYSRKRWVSWEVESFRVDVDSRNARSDWDGVNCRSHAAKPKSSRKSDLTQSRTVDYFESVVRRRIKVACMSAVVGGSSRTVAIVYECVVANLGSGWDVDFSLSR